jgi:predicted secreted hydrolase
MAVSVPYWEGPVRIAGSHTGRGYLEMTGYE